MIWAGPTVPSDGRFKSVPNSMDGDEHRRFRSVVDRFLSSSRVAAFVPSFRQLSEEVVAALSRGVTVDAVDAIGLPIRVQPARRVPSRAKRRAQPRVWDRSSRLSWARNREA